MLKKIAIVGYGYWGPNLLRNFSNNLDCEVLYCCDLDIVKLKKVRKAYPSIMLTKNYEDILNDSEVDAVVIATPTKFHHPLAKAALESGKDVLIEKPMTLDTKEAKELVEIAQKNNKILMVDHTFLFTQEVRKLKEIIDSGEIGEVLHIDSTRANLGLFQPDSNVVFDLATHDISIIQYLLGKFPKSLTSVGASYYDKQEEVCHLHLDYPGKTTCHIHVSWLSPLKIRQMMIVGTKKMIVYNDVEPSEKVKIYDKGVTVNKHKNSTSKVLQTKIGYRSGDVWAPRIDIVEGLKTLSQEFLTAISERKTTMSSGEFGMSVVNILEKANESSRKSVKVSLI